MAVSPAREGIPGRLLRGAGRDRHARHGRHRGAADGLLPGHVRSEVDAAGDHRGPHRGRPGVRLRQGRAAPAAARGLDRRPARPRILPAGLDAAVNLPSRVFRRDIWLPCVLVGLPSVVAVMVVLHLGWTALVPLMVASVVAVLYAAVLQYFGIEIGMRPVVDDIVRVLPSGFGFEPVGMPLRVKLLTILPLMSLITGLVVAALTGGDNKNLGVSVLITLAVAFSISLELTLLLSDSILRPMSALHDGIRAVQRGEYDVQIPVTTSDDVGELTDGFNRMAAGLAERERLREAFGTYLDREVAEYILNEGVNLAGIEVDVSVLFCDVRDFTAFASRADSPEHLVAALNG